MPYCSYHAVVETLGVFTDGIGSLRIVAYLLAFIASQMEQLYHSPWHIFCLCFLISILVALCWLLLIYFGCHYLIMALTPYSGCRYLTFADYPLISAIIMLFISHYH